MTKAAGQHETAITEEMVDAGISVLGKAGIVEGHAEIKRAAVAEIYRAMRAQKSDDNVLHRAMHAQVLNDNLHHRAARAQKLADSLSGFADANARWGHLGPSETPRPDSVKFNGRFYRVAKEEKHDDGSITLNLDPDNLK